MENTNKKGKGAYLIIAVGLIFIVFLGVYFWTDIFTKTQVVQESEYYTNERGEKWTLPDGKYDFTVSAAGFPKFLSGSINPLKVRVGDTQKMTIRVASPIPIKSVIAEIETDKDTKIVPLLLKESKVLSADYMRDQKYLIDENGELIINNTNAGYAEKVIENLIEKAEAQSLMEYTYEGEWIVHDTHTKTYRTKFIAEDEEGNKGKMTLAWSDPECEFDSEGALKISCSPSSGAEGIDGLDINLNDNNINLSGDAKLYWNGGLEAGGGGQRSINIGKGSISLESKSTAEIREALLYYSDEDGDTWASSIEFIITYDPARIRAKDSPSRPWQNPAPPITLDCLDTNADVHPGQTKYFNTCITVNETCAGYDYDCSGSTEGGWATNAVTSTTQVYSVVARENPLGECDQAEAFSYALDGCGTNSVVADGCNTDGVGACKTGTGYRPQEDTGQSQNAWFTTALSCIATTVRSFCR